MKRLIIRGAVLCSLMTLVLLTGCVGVYDNTERFLNDPAVGTSEWDLLKAYGTPAFETETGDQKILTYKVRESKYVVLVGMYRGYDLIVRMKDGLVAETYKAGIPNKYSLLQPVPWAVSD